MTLHLAQHLKKAHSTHFNAICSCLRRSVKKTSNTGAISRTLNKTRHLKNAFLKIAFIFSLIFAMLFSFIGSIKATPWAPCHHGGRQRTRREKDDDSSWWLINWFALSRGWRPIDQIFNQTLMRLIKVINRRIRLGFCLPVRLETVVTCHTSLHNIVVSWLTEDGSTWRNFRNSLAIENSADECYESMLKITFTRSRQVSS